MFLSLEWSYWITLLLSVFAAGFLVRIFIIQHDCGHGSFFSSRKISDFVGMFCSFFTLTPYHYWKQSHSIHHASAGNLELRGIGDIYTMTVAEYLSRPLWKRFLYRLYRNPFVLFVFIPTILFVILYRFPIARSRSLAPTYPSIFYTNVALVAFYGILGSIFGFTDLLMVQLPITIIASSVGTWLFYIQHQFEETYWANNTSWDYTMAALRGSSYYRLPKVLQWFTGNIGFHHIHHLNPKIPNYVLEKCYKEVPFLQKAPTLTLWSSIRTAALSLWDENQKKLVSFRFLKRLRIGLE